MANPVTDTTRRFSRLLAHAKAASISAGVPAEVYAGSTYQGMADLIPALLVQSQGRPCAIVCYGGSEYGNSPRRISTVNIVVLQGHTRAVSGALTVLGAAEDIIARLDDVIYQDVEGDYPITEKWRIASDELVDIEGLEAACMVLSFTVEDH
jgi:hypothetical protein